MKAVIIKHRKNADKVARLVEHCRALDGTELTVVDQSGKFLNTPYPEVCNLGFLDVLRSQKEPFMFLEDDSIPLKAGWLSTLEADFWARSGLVLVSRDFQTPFDLFSGVGVYDPVIGKDMPEAIAGVGWDEWIGTYRPQWIARTDLIQHIYGRYTPDSMATEWEFPRDRWIIRETALVFHKDAQQGLLNHDT